MSESVEYIRDHDVIRHHCLVSTCAWAHDEPACNPAPLLVGRDPDTGELDLDDAFKRRRDERDQRIAGILHDHHATHTAEDWANEVRTLRNRVTEYKNAAEQDSYGIRPHAPRWMVDALKTAPAPLWPTGLDG